MPQRRLERLRLCGDMASFEPATQAYRLNTVCFVEGDRLQYIILGLMVAAALTRPKIFGGREVGFGAIGIAGVVASVVTGGVPLGAGVGNHREHGACCTHNRQPHVIRRGMPQRRIAG